MADWREGTGKRRMKVKLSVSFFLREQSDVNTRTWLTEMIELVGVSLKVQKMVRLKGR